MNWLWLNTDHVWVLSRLAYFYKSYCLLLKISFLDVSLQSFEILNWNFKYELVLIFNTDQVWVSSRLTHFYRSYCPLLKFSFPDFSLQSLGILTLNVLYEFAFTFFRLCTAFVAFNILSLELYFPLLKLLFSAVFGNIDLKCVIWICLHVFQIMYNFCRV